MNKEILSYLIEFIGTFIFLYVIAATGEPIAITVALLAMIYFGGKISGGAFNPAVSFLLYLKDEISTNKLFGYIVVQLLGAFLAYKLFYHTHINKLN